MWRCTDSAASDCVPNAKAVSHTDARDCLVFCVFDFCHPSEEGRRRSCGVQMTTCVWWVELMGSQEGVRMRARGLNLQIPFYIAPMEACQV